jgi:hypothetical protein
VKVKASEVYGCSDAFLNYDYLQILVTI